MAPRKPRITPGNLRDLGLVNGALARALGVASGGAPPNIFLTLGRHRTLFRKWLLFAGGLMPGGTLKRSESELVILRVAATMRCAYEWDHHERLAKRAGVSEQAIECVRQGDLDAECFSPRERAFLQACQDLYDRREILEDTWRALIELATEVEIIELCMLVGHYQMLAMTLNTLRVPLDVR